MITSDFATLKDIFGYKAYPFGVPLENGFSKGPLTMFDGSEPAATLRKLRMVQ